MANTTGKLYIRSKQGYRKPPKRLASLPVSETFVLMWYGASRRKSRVWGVSQTPLKPS